MASILFTSAAYPLSTLRVPVGEIDDERNQNAVFKAFLTMTDGVLVKSEVGAYLSEARENNKSVLTLELVTGKGKHAIEFKLKSTNEIPKKAIISSHGLPGNFYVVYKLKEGRSVFGFPGFMHALVINPMEIKRGDGLAKISKPNTRNKSSKRIYRTDEEIKKDRIKLKDLLSKRKLTRKELALLTGRPKMAVKYDIRSDPELKDNDNLLKRKYPAEKKIKDNLQSLSGIRQNI